MKIAYIYIQNMPLPGVDKKPTDQAAALKEMEETRLDIFVLNPNFSGQKQGVNYIKYRQFNAFPYFDYLLKHTFWRYSVLKNINTKIYDYIILRYPKADYSGLRFYKNNKVISEHHGEEFEELRLEGENSNSLLFKYFKFLRAFLEKKYAPKILSHAKGIIDMYPYGEQSKIKYTSRNLPRLYTGNGISTNKTKFTGFKAFDGKVLNIIFPASHDLFFHGIDRLIKAAENYSGTVKINIHIAGNFKGSALLENPFVKYHGTLHGKDYDSLLSKMNLGASTLGLYRKGLQYSGSLKTRDFTARGLPFIIGHTDIDLSKHKPEIPFYLS
ncbi:MAG: hypothetical protein U9N85_03975, partial [Bacteroidota bacterium]|nr:hypothetical protein [Bacteroidota bacterium]